MERKQNGTEWNAQWVMAFSGNSEDLMISGTYMMDGKDQLATAII